MCAMTTRVAFLAALLYGGSAFAAMDVKVTENQLSVTCDTSGTVIAKVVAPDGTVLVDTRFEGYRFTWTPSGADGAYRYDIQVLLPQEQENNTMDLTQSSPAPEYAGGSVEVRNGKIINPFMY